MGPPQADTEQPVASHPFTTPERIAALQLACFRHATSSA